MTDDQIRALVAAARRLGQRRRSGADEGTAATDERLQRLDWAVRAGELALAERANRAPAGSVHRRWGVL